VPLLEAKGLLKPVRARFEGDMSKAAPKRLTSQAPLVLSLLITHSAAIVQVMRDQVLLFVSAYESSPSVHIILYVFLRIPAALVQRHGLDAPGPWKYCLANCHLSIGVISARMSIVPKTGGIHTGKELWQRSLAYRKAVFRA
jgi:hypothetical protein